MNIGGTIATRAKTPAPTTRRLRPAMIMINPPVAAMRIAVPKSG